MSLSVEELAARAGTSPDAVRRLADLGVLPGDPESLAEAVVPRVRLALQLEASGVPLDDVGRAIADGTFSLAFADTLFGRPVGMLEIPRHELERELSLSAEFLDEIRLALGVTGTGDEPIREDDAELLRTIDRFIHQGLDERVAEQVTIRYFYVLAEASRMVAEGGKELWRTGVEEPLLARGLTWGEYLEAVASPGPGSQLLAERMLILLLHRFLESVIVQEAIQIIENALDEAGIRRPRQDAEPAIAFLDLSGYTRLTEAAGDDLAAQHARTLVDLARRASVQHGGRLVKTLGDGAMFHFDQPSAAVRCGLELVERAPTEGLPPARVGVNAGPLVHREGDYFGRTVNIAARVTEYARPNEVLATAEAMRRCEGIEFEGIGEVSLKGVPDPVELFSARPTSRRRSDPAGEPATG